MRVMPKKYTSASVSQSGQDTIQVDSTLFPGKDGRGQL